MLEYVVYSIRMQAWVAPAGGVSDWKSAKRMSRNAAFAMCARSRDHNGNFACVPVLVSNLEQLESEAR